MPKHKKLSKKEQKDKNANDSVTMTMVDGYSYRLTMATGPPNYKIILCGEYGVGKSSLFRRFMNDTLSEERGTKSSIGLDQASQMFHVLGEDVKVSHILVLF